jgi:outer membrane protein OmpA-like peptidoglycan-associated protein
MQDKSSENMPAKKTKLIHRVWFWILIGLVIAVVLFFIMLPVGIDYGVERYLKDQGVDQATLEDVDFNPITGRMTLTNLSIIIGTQTVLKIPQATFRILWTPFVRKRVVLERFIISDTELIVQALKDGRLRVGGIMLPQKEETSEPSAWNFGLQQVTVENCKIKFISPQLSSELKIKQAKITKLRSWMPERSAELEFKGQLNDGDLQLQMAVFPFSNELAVSGQIKLKGLTLSPFAPLLKPPINILDGRFDADLTIETRQVADSGFSHRQKGILRLSQIRTQIEDTELSNESLAWDGAVQVEIPKSGKGLKISTDGKLNGSNLSMDAKNANMQIQQEHLNWEGRLDYEQTPAAANLNADSALSLQNIGMKTPDLKFTEEKFDWRGTLQFSTTAATGSQRVIADGTLDGNHLQADLTGRKLHYEHQELSWKGHLDSGNINDFSSLGAKANFSLKDVEILHSETNQRLLNSESVDLQAIKVEGLDKISVSDIALKGLALLADHKSVKSSAAEPPLLRIQEVKLKDLQLSQQNNLAIDAVNLQALQAYVQRNSQGKLPAIERLKAIQNDVSSGDQSNQAASDSKAKKETDKFGLRIGQVEITGDSNLRFKDESVNPAFSIDLSLLEARLVDLDSRAPEKPATLKLLISDGRDARLSLDGTVQPFTEQVNLNWAAKIESLGLPALSPYVIQNTGYRFVSGELQADIPVEINQNQIEGKIDLIMYKPTVERAKSKASLPEKQGKIQIGMPLDSALKLMRDKQNNVRLNIPLSGDINDPKFSVADAVNRVLAKTLQSAAVSYLKYMLGPYGIGISVAELAYEQATKIRLNPILFAPGSDDLDEAAIDYLQRVAAIMKEYPKVQVSVCGVATESDRTALNGNSSKENAALLELAEKRTERIHDQLVKLHGIAAKRIIACEPQIDTSPDARPRAKLGI